MAEIQEIQELAPDFRIRINGSELPPEAAADVIAVQVTEDVDAASMFTIRMVNWDDTALSITWSDHDLFAEGSEVEIEMGYLDNTEKLIGAEITGLEPEFCIDNAPMLTVRGYDRRHRLSRGRYTRSFTQVKDSDIASTIASEVGLSAEVDDTGITLDYVLQHNQTDLEFLRDRARRHGYEVVVEDKILRFRARQHTTGEVLTLTYENDILEFHPCLSTMGQVGKIAVRGWSPKDKAALVSEVAAGSESTTMGGSRSGPQAAEGAFKPSPMAIVDRPVFSQAEADGMAQGRFDEMALAYISGDGVCVGRTDLRAGTVIDMQGLGERFSGLYYLTSVTHSYSPSRGYRTSFSVGRNAT